MMEPWFAVPALALFSLVVLAVVVGYGFMIHAAFFRDR